VNRRGACTLADQAGSIANAVVPAGGHMTTRRHLHHVHSGWPAPYAGVIAAVVFGVAIAFFALLWLTR
jgi:hypothetical protein